MSGASELISSTLIYPFSAAGSQPERKLARRFSGTGSASSDARAMTTLSHSSSVQSFSAPAQPVRQQRTQISASSRFMRFLPFTKMIYFYNEL